LGKENIFILLINYCAIINSQLTNNYCHLLYFLQSSIFKVLQSRPKLVKMSAYQTAWIWVRRTVSYRSKLFAYGTYCEWRAMS